MQKGKEYARDSYKQINITANGKWIDAVKEYSKQRGMTVNAFVRMIIDKEMMLHPIDQYTQEEDTQEEEITLTSQKGAIVDKRGIDAEVNTEEESAKENAVMKAKREIVQAIVEALQKSIV